MKAKKSFIAAYYNFLKFFSWVVVGFFSFLKVSEEPRVSETLYFPLQGFFDTAAYRSCSAVTLM